MVPKKSSSEQTTYDKALYERESPKPGFETNMARLIMGCDSVLWWHKIIENSADEFCINGFIDHYPDFVVKTKKGNIVMIETKGSHLNNPDTQRKIVLGKAWASYACMASHNAPVYRYYMVFEDENKKADESISASTMIQYLKEL